MLLDTHALLWLLSDDDRLGPRTRQTLGSAVAVHASAASLWETAIKASLGKLTVPDDLPTHVQRAGLQWLEVRTEHVWTSRGLEGLPHRDPFDRLLCGQACAERLPFVTADRQLLTASLSPDVQRLDART